MAACKESTNVIAPNGTNIDPAINEKELEFGRVNAKVSVVSTVWCPFSGSNFIYF